MLVQELCSVAWAMRRRICGVADREDAPVWRGGGQWTGLALGKSIFGPRMAVRVGIPARTSDRVAVDPCRSRLAPEGACATRSEARASYLCLIRNTKPYSDEGRRLTGVSHYHRTGSLGLGGLLAVHHATRSFFTGRNVWAR
jgi:hypothetical protein